MDDNSTKAAETVPSEVKDALNHVDTTNPYASDYAEQLISLSEDKRGDNAEIEASEIDRLRAQLKDTEERLAEAEKNNVIDHLTGCFNSAYFEKYKAENFNPDHDRDKIALVYIDLNDLKTTNDTYGHQVGDQLIIDTANFLKEQFREEDIVIHLHGDEFVVICRDRKDGIDYEKLKARVDGMRNLALGLERPLNFADGVAVFDGQDHDGKIDTNLSDTEARAEQEMYRVKKEMKTNR
jgi:diguanylate cyclase (GGDEF)-like protein